MVGREEKILRRGAARVWRLMLRPPTHRPPAPPLFAPFPSARPQRAYLPQPLPPPPQRASLPHLLPLHRVLGGALPGRRAQARPAEPAARCAPAAPAPPAARTPAAAAPGPAAGPAAAGAAGTRGGARPRLHRPHAPPLPGSGARGCGRGTCRPATARWGQQQQRRPVFFGEAWEGGRGGRGAGRAHACAAGCRGGCVRAPRPCARLVALRLWSPVAKARALAYTQTSALCVYETHTHKHTHTHSHCLSRTHPHTPKFARCRRLRRCCAWCGALHPTPMRCTRWQARAGRARRRWVNPNL